jgi:hypothetical protein
MIKKYIAMALTLMAIVVGLYVYQFYYTLGYVISDDASDWVAFSAYVGGVLGPLLSFLSLILLVQTLKLQNSANVELRNEARLNQKNETFRSFESHFFNLLGAQRTAFENFQLDIPLNETKKKSKGVDAVIELENLIESMRYNNLSSIDIEGAIDNIDSSEKIYNTIRIFYNITKMVSEKLADDKGFDIEVRKSQFQTLITFTEFSQLRLVLISMQFMDCPAAEYLKSNTEFVDVIIELGLEIDPY